MLKKRKWNDEYVRYGFTALLDDCGGPDQAQCMTCHFIMYDSNLKPARLKAQQDINRLSRLCRLKGLDMAKEVHYPIWIQGNAKATSKSFLRGGIPEHPSEGCTFSQEKPNYAMHYTNARTGLGK